MKTVSVDLGERSYSVIVCPGVVSAMLEQVLALEEIALVTDENIPSLPWFTQLEGWLRKKAGKFLRCTIPAGEKGKDLAVVGRLASELAQANFTRRSAVFAVGGGVVGDTAGFLAASYLRGVRFAQIPTTLLACVDSSVGGKTGVNLPEGKNLFGAFYQPEAVFIDPTYLDTLAPREYSAGMAEVLKSALIRDEVFWEKLASDTPPTLEEIIVRSVQIKAEIVMADERETNGLRALLNFGHTIGHAIEQVTHYEQWLHGEAVAMGMVVAARISHLASSLPAEGVDQIISILERQGLPTRLGTLSHYELSEAMGRDKKATTKGLRWILLDKIGKARLTDKVPESTVVEAVELSR